MYIKLGEDMSLTITVKDPIYRGDNLSRKMIYLVPLVIGEVDVLTANLYLNYIRADGTADVVYLERMENLYKEAYYQYTVPITCKLTKYAGEVCTWIQMMSGPPSAPVIAKSGECPLYVQESKNMDEYLCDHQLSALYQIHRTVQIELDEAQAEIDRMTEELAAKADGLVYDAETRELRLVSGEEPVGEVVIVPADTFEGVASFVINEDGDLIATFMDGREENLGRVVGKDGAVYVPQIDEHHILSFVLSEEPTEPPEPVDLNPHDEWSGMDESEIETTYIWEPIA